MSAGGIGMETTKFVKPKKDFVVKFLHPTVIKENTEIILEGSVFIDINGRVYELSADNFVEGKYVRLTLKDEEVVSRLGYHRNKVKKIHLDMKGLEDLQILVNQIQKDKVILYLTGLK